MIMPLLQYGLAYAFYNNNPPKVTLTELVGIEKRDIRIERTRTQDITSPQALEEMLGILISTMQKYTQWQHPDTKLAIVTGSEMGFDNPSLFAMLAHLYGTVPVEGIEEELELGEKLDIREIQKRLQRAPPEIQNYIHNQCIHAVLVQGGYDPKKVYLAPYRSFISVAKAREVSRTQVLGSHEVLTDAIRQPIEQLLVRWENGEKDVQEELIRQSRGLGAFFAEWYKTGEKATGQKLWEGSRFFSADDSVRAGLYKIPGAREAYAEEFMRNLNIPYNICIKSTQDKRSPPYSDVAAAVMADFIDKRTGEKPTAILVNVN